VLPWSFVVGYALPADPPAGETVPLRAMIVTAHDGTADAGDIAAAVRSQRTDVLVVTELSSALAHDLTPGLPEGMLARYVSVPDPGASPAAGIGIYSRFPIDGKQATRLAGTHWPAVVVPVPVGRTTVTLVAGHAVQPSTGHLDRWRRDLAAFRAAERIKGPVLVLVNLNATPWNPQYRRIVSGRLHDAADVLGRGLRPTWPTWSPVPLLSTDHALVAGLGVSELSALSVKGSDHRALSVGLRVPTPPR
jgi:endonuclease/exonuclease/phosphatase (EEP) superfamily protein YafD